MNHAESRPSNDEESKNLVEIVGKGKPLIVNAISKVRDSDDLTKVAEHIIYQQAFSGKIGSKFTLKCTKKT
jgi:hypothetical protein